jgi:hypothetical protein
LRALGAGLDVMLEKSSTFLLALLGEAAKLFSDILAFVTAVFFLKILKFNFYG